MALRLDQQTALITGGTGAIGKETALRCAQLGAAVIIVGRDPAKGAACAAEIKAEVVDGSVTFLQADLSRMRNVSEFAMRLPARASRLNILIHCAGVTLRERTITDEGFETVFAVQYLARFLLTARLLDLLVANKSPCVIDVSGGGTVKTRVDFDNLNGEKHYDGIHALRHEAVLNDMFILESQKRQAGVRFYNYGPGYIATPLLQNLALPTRMISRVAGSFIGIKPSQAAEDITNLVLSDKPSGLYTRNGKRNEPTLFTGSTEKRAELWQITEKMLDKVTR